MKIDKKLLDNDIGPSAHAEQCKELRSKFPPYKISALRQQIVQCKEAIVRCEDVVQQENNSITEFSEVRVLCEQRDKELAQYGAVAEGS